MCILNLVILCAGLIVTRWLIVVLKTFQTTLRPCDRPLSCTCSCTFYQLQTWVHSCIQRQVESILNWPVAKIQTYIFAVFVWLIIVALVKTAGFWTNVDLVRKLTVSEVCENV